MQLHFIRCKRLLFIYALILGVLFCNELCADMAEQPWRKERVWEVIQQSVTNPNALWELKDAPLELIYTDLRGIWMTHASLVEDRMAMKKEGREAEWLEVQAKTGRNPDYSQRAYVVARDVLLAHPDFESYLSGRIGHMSEVLLRKEADGAFQQNNADVPGADVDYSRLLDVAYRTPGDTAFRIIGPCLFGAYYPVRDYGDYTVSSPAVVAHGLLSSLARERLQEEIPKDVEGARSWWQSNAHRFATKPAPGPPTALLAATTSAPGPTSTPTPQSLSLNLLKSRYALWGVIGSLALVLLVTLRVRRKDE